MSPALAGPLGLDAEPETGPRPPNRRWTRRDWQVVEVWVVDLGRPYGVRLDWRLSGREMAPIYCGSPAGALLEVLRWRRRDTAPIALTHKSGRMRPGVQR